jgi:hypothetical protein
MGPPVGDPDSPPVVTVDATMRGAIKRAAEALVTPLPPDSPSSQLQRVQQAWRDIAQASAQCYFAPNGQIDLGNATVLQTFWKSVNPTESPFSVIPGIELVKEQTLVVLEKLLMPPGEGPSLMGQLLSSSEVRPSPQGEIILGTMGIVDTSSPQAIPQAILQSLFTPHRQTCLPTCNINALINAEIFNHPERLADIYTQILTSNPNSRISLPASGNRIQTQPITAGPQAHISATFNQNKESMEGAFLDLVQDASTTPLTFKTETPDDYKPFGVALHIDEPSKPPIVSEGGRASFSLDLPVHDPNDVFFANFVHAIYKDIDQSEVFVKVRDLYFGVPGNEFAGDSTFNADVELLETDGSSSGCFGFSEKGISNLINRAKELLRTGTENLATVFSNPEIIPLFPPMPPMPPIHGPSDPSDTSDTPNTPNTPPFSTPFTREKLSPYRGHVENINLKQLAALNINTLEGAGTLTMWAIGDENYVDSSGAPTYLHIIKIRDDQFMITGREICSSLAIYPLN